MSALRADPTQKANHQSSVCAGTIDTPHNEIVQQYQETFDKKQESSEEKGSDCPQTPRRGGPLNWWKQNRGETHGGISTPNLCIWGDL